MTIDELLDGILQREGAGTPPYLDPADRGGRTSWGIDERSHPDAWRAGPPTREDAKAIYAKQYVAPFAQLAALGLDERVRIALIDDAVLSGVTAAIRSLQQVVGVPADGILGSNTVVAVGACDGQWLLVRLVQLRARRLARIVEKDRTQTRFLVGWIDRALSFLG